MKSKTPSTGRGLQEMKRTALFFAHCAAAVKCLFVSLAVHDLAPAALVAFLLRVLRLGGA
ncbi:MAG: hypothetical protein FD177_52 [Desulfovibrionaceae bacterium]|nr:MAG: hypothetical protein FD177_52 [Desulfovibrionaceae bacterium]